MLTWGASSPSKPQLLLWQRHWCPQSARHPLKLQQAVLHGVQKLILVKCLEDENRSADIQGGNCQCRENVSLHWREAGLCVPQKPAFRIPVSDLSESCDSRAGK